VFSSLRIWNGERPQTIRAQDAKRDILRTKVLVENSDRYVHRSSNRIAARHPPPRARIQTSRFSSNQPRSLSLKPNSLGLNHVQEIDLKKVEALKKAVYEGTYAVAAEDLVPKLMESMFRNTILDEVPDMASGSQLETNDQVNPQQRVAPEVPGGEMVSRKDSRSASVPSDGSPAKRGPKQGFR
jgi:anti-sigma28 factor (negative regulator of flagellin synthesis)